LLFLKPPAALTIFSCSIILPEYVKKQLKDLGYANGWNAAKK